MLATICCISLLTACTKTNTAPHVDVDTSPITSSSNDLNGNDKIVIGSITMLNNGEWYGEVMAGVKTAAADLGVKLIDLNSNGSVENEEKYIHQLIEDKVNAIVICPITADHTGTLLLEAENAGIPAITWNTVVDADITAEVCVDSNALGGDTGTYLTEYVRTYNLSNLKIGLITNQSYTIGVARCDGFKESIKGIIKDGSATIVSELLAESTEESTAAVTKMLSEHPDLDIIWCWNQTSLLACIDVVKSQGKSDLVVMGTDMSMDLAKDMQTDDVNLMAVTTQLPYNMGYKAVVNAVLAAKKKPVDKTIVIPTFTYKKADADLISQYIETHQAFAQ